MRTSVQINEIATALSKAQSEIEDATKSRKNTFFSSNYATLNDVWDAIREPLTKNGLAVTQVTSQNQHGLVLNTLLMHSSGQYIQGEYPINPVKTDPQGVGSAITYARRYALMSAVGVCPEDDDGNAASSPAPAPVSRLSRPSPAPAQTEKQAESPTPPAKPAGSWNIPWKTAESFGKTFKEKVVKAPDIAAYDKLFTDNEENILRLLDENMKLHDSIIAIANERKDTLTQKEKGNG